MRLLPYSISLNRVYDTVKIKEGGNSLILKVNADSRQVVTELTAVQKRLQAMTDSTPGDERHEVCMQFATVIFGAEQAKELSEFYGNDDSCLLGICGKYFADRLSKLISSAQKKMK